MSKSWLVNMGTSLALSDNTTNYVGVGSNSINATEANTLAQVRDALTMRNLFVRTKASTIVASSSYTVRKTGADTALSVSMASSAFGDFTDSDSVSFAATDSFCVKAAMGTDAATTSMNFCGYAIEVEPSTSGNCLSLLQIVGASAMATASTAYFFAPSGHSSTVPTTETDQQLKVRFNCTARNLYCRISSNSRSTISAVVSRVNGADGGQTFNIGAAASGVFEDGAGSDTLIEGDLYCCKVTTGTGTGTLTASLFGSTLVTTTGQWQNVSYASAGASLSAGLTRFAGLGGRLVMNTTESDIAAPAPFDILALLLDVRLTTNSLSGACTVTLSKDGVDEDLTLSIGAAATGLFTDDVHVSGVGDGEKVAWKVVSEAGSGSASFRTISVIGAESVATDQTLTPNASALSVSAPSVSVSLSLARTPNPAIVTVAPPSIGTVAVDRIMAPQFNRVTVAPPFTFVNHAKTMSMSAQSVVVSAVGPTIVHSRTLLPTTVVMSATAPAAGVHFTLAPSPAVLAIAVPNPVVVRVITPLSGFTAFLRPLVAVSHLLPISPPATAVAITAPSVQMDRTLEQPVIERVILTAPSVSVSHLKILAQTDSLELAIEPVTPNVIVQQGPTQPSTVALVVSIPDPTVIVDQFVTPSGRALLLTPPVVRRDFTLLPSPPAIVVSAPDIAFHRDLLPNPVVLLLGAPSVGVLAGGTIGPIEGSLGIVAPSPTIVFGVIVKRPTPTEFHINPRIPSIQHGGVVLNPDPAVLVLIAADPFADAGTRPIDAEPAVVQLHVPDISLTFGETALSIIGTPLLIEALDVDITLDAAGVPAACVIVLSVPDVEIVFGITTMNPDGMPLAIVAPACSVVLGTPSLLIDPVPLPLVVPDVAIAHSRTLSPFPAEIMAEPQGVVVVLEKVIDAPGLRVDLLRPAVTVLQGQINLSPFAAVVHFVIPSPKVSGGVTPEVKAGGLLLVAADGEYVVNVTSEAEATVLADKQWSTHEV